MNNPADEPVYRAFLMDAENKVFQAVVLAAKSDDEAREQARAYRDGCGVEVWDRARVVATYPSDRAVVR